MQGSETVFQTLVRKYDDWERKPEGDPPAQVLFRSKQYGYTAVVDRFRKLKYTSVVFPDEGTPQRTALVANLPPSRAYGLFAVTQAISAKILKITGTMPAPLLTASRLKAARFRSLTLKVSALPTTRILSYSPAKEVRVKDCMKQTSLNRHQRNSTKYGVPYCLPAPTKKHLSCSWKHFTLSHHCLMLQLCRQKKSRTSNPSSWMVFELLTR